MRILLCKAPGETQISERCQRKVGKVTVQQFFFFSISGYWPLNAALCDLFVTSDVLMCTSSILHLCTISLERYIAIRSPLSCRKRSKTGVKLKITLVWAISFAISSPIMILGFVNERNILNDNQCVLRNNDFIIYGSVSAFFIPLGIMGILFGFTIKLLQKQWKLCDPSQSKEGEMNIRRSKSDQTVKLRGRRLREGRGEQQKRPYSCPNPPNCFGNLAESRQSSQDQEEEQLCNTPESSEYHIIGINKLKTSQAPSEETVEEMIPLQASTDESSQNADVAPRSGDENDNLEHTGDIIQSTPKKPISKTMSTPSRLHQLVRKHQIIWKSSSLLMLKKDSVKQKQHKNNVKTEQKASKVLGIVFVIFVICWTPFFIVNILTALCAHCHFEHLMVTIFVWLGYLSSTLNPIIYTMFNRTFRTTFIKLLRCEYRFLQKPMRVKTISSGNCGQITQSPRKTGLTYMQIPLWISSRQEAELLPNMCFSVWESGSYCIFKQRIEKVQIHTVWSGLSESVDTFSYSVNLQRRLWSDWANAQSNLGLRCPYMV